MTTEELWFYVGNNVERAEYIEEAQYNNSHYEGHGFSRQSSRDTTHHYARAAASAREGTWAEAEAYCVSRGGHVASLHSSLDNDKAAMACKIGLRNDGRWSTVADDSLLKDHVYCWIGAVPKTSLQPCATAGCSAAQHRQHWSWVDNSLGDDIDFLAATVHPNTYAFHTVIHSQTGVWYYLRETSAGPIVHGVPSGGDMVLPCVCQTMLDQTTSGMLKVGSFSAKQLQPFVGKSVQFVIVDHNTNRLSFAQSSESNYDMGFIAVDNVRLPLHVSDRTLMAQLRAAKLDWSIDWNSCGQFQQLMRGMCKEVCNELTECRGLSMKAQRYHLSSQMACNLHFDPGIVAESRPGRQRNSGGALTELWYGGFPWDSVFLGIPGVLRGTGIVDSYIQGLDTSANQDTNRCYRKQAVSYNEGVTCHLRFSSHLREVYVDGELVLDNTFHRSQSEVKTWLDCDECQTSARLRCNKGDDWSSTGFISNVSSGTLGKRAYSEVSNQLDDKYATKTLTFKESVRQLSFYGYDRDAGCQGAGFAMRCSTANPDSRWNIHTGELHGWSVWSPTGFSMSIRRGRPTNPQLFVPAKLL